MSSWFEKIKNLATPSSQTESTGRLRVLFRPDRWTYVRKLAVEPECVFCKANRLAPSFETLCVFKTESSMILMNKFPYNSGHLLVIPQRHEGDFLSLTAAEYEDLHYALKLAVAAVKSVYQPHGVNLGMNLDKAAGAGIPDHMHYHVVPRFKGDLNFFPLIAETKVISESMEDAYKKIKNHFSGVRL